MEIMSARRVLVGSERLVQGFSFEGEDQGGGLGESEGV